MHKDNMILIKEKTRSLCNICHNEIDASVYEDNGKVFLEKECLAHGTTKSIIEKDTYFYRKLAHTKKRTEDNNFYVLVVPITYRCNLNCEFCFLPQRDKKDMSFDKIKGIISGFKGYYIALSGGEPTLCDYLPEIIQYVHASDKKSILVTNGLLLRDINYVKALKKAGIDQVELSFDGFGPEAYGPSKQPEDIVKGKIAALKNLEKENIPTMLSITIYRNINEKELQKVFDLAAKSSAVFRLKIRTSVKVGKFNQSIDSYFMSELLEMFSDTINIRPGKLLSSYAPNIPYFSPHGVPLKIYYIIFKGKIIMIPFAAKVINFFYYLSFVLMVRFRLKNVLPIAYKLKRKKGSFLRCLHLQICQWPVLETVDLGELKAGTAHFYDGQVINFCHAVILNQRL